MADHTEACAAARAGHKFKEINRRGRLVTRPDPYPLLFELTEDQRTAVLACSHRDHDVVRLFVGLVGS